MVQSSAGQEGRPFENKRATREVSDGPRQTRKKKSWFSFDVWHFLLLFPPTARNPRRGCNQSLYHMHRQDNSEGEGEEHPAVTAKLHAHTSGFFFLLFYIVNRWPIMKVFHWNVRGALLFRHAGMEDGQHLDGEAGEAQLHRDAHRVSNSIQPRQVECCTVWTATYPSYQLHHVCCYRVVASLASLSWDSYRECIYVSEGVLAVSRIFEGEGALGFPQFVI